VPSAERRPARAVAAPNQDDLPTGKSDLQQTTAIKQRTALVEDSMLLTSMSA
jgi:hypothetical protein